MKGYFEIHSKAYSNRVVIRARFLAYSEIMSIYILLNFSCHWQANLNGYFLWFTAVSCHITMSLQAVVSLTLPWQCLHSTYRCYAGALPHKLHILAKSKFY